MQLGIRLLGVVLFGLLTACGTGAPTVSQMTRTCAFLASCSNGFFGLGAVRDGRCVYQQQQAAAIGVRDATESNHDRACANDSRTCDAYNLCLSRNHGPSWCATHGGRHCDGTSNILVNCSSPSSYGSSTDCAARGGNITCREGNNTGACTDGTACSIADAARCNGQLAMNCNVGAGLFDVVNCDQYWPGSQCGVVNNRAQCLKSGPNCQQQDARCDGATTLVVCDNDTNREYRIDCAAVVDGRCAAVNNRFECVPNANSCNIGDDNRCMGNNLQMCVSGRWENVDCSTLGFRTCALVTGVLGAAVAACSN